MILHDPTDETPDDYVGQRKWLSRRMWGPVLLSIVVAFVWSGSIAAGLLLATPVLGHPSQWTLAIACLAVGATAGWAWWRWLMLRPHAAVSGMLVAALVFAGAAIGVERSIVVGGRVVLDSDVQAAEVRYDEALRVDAAQVHAVLGLLSTSETEAAARYSEFAPASEEMRSIVARLNVEPIPNEVFVPAAELLRSAALLADQALQAKSALVLEPDVNRAEDNAAVTEQLAGLLIDELVPSIERAATAAGIPPRGGAQ